MKNRRFVIPDVHGCAITLRRLIEATIGLERHDTVYLLGDLIDRGPDAKGVIDYILLLRDNGYRPVVLRGNHEQMLLDACLDRDNFRLWMMNGGNATLESFGVEDACEIPAHYRRFFAGLPLYLVLPGYVLVHACLDCSLNDPYVDVQTMLWSRNCLIDRRKLGGRQVVSGHTSCRHEEVVASLTADRITLDNGCVYRDMPGMGQLTALDLDARQLYFQKNVEED